MVFVACDQFDELPPPRAFRDPDSSGGIVVDMGVHEFDQLRWLTGREIVDVRGVAGSVGLDEPVDGDPELVELSVELEGGDRRGDHARPPLPARRDLPRRGDRPPTGPRPTEFVAPPDGDETIAAALRAQAEDFARDGGEGTTIDDAVAALAAAVRAPPGARASLTLLACGEVHRRQQLGVDPRLLGRRQARDAVDAAGVEVHELAAGTTPRTTR